MNQQLPPSSLPIDPLSVAAHYFSLYCLEFSFQLLREHYPALALAIQNLIALARLNPHNSLNNNLSNNLNNNSEDKLLELDLDVQLVSDIVSALTEIAEQTASSDVHDKENRLAIHQTLLNWLLYAQRFLNEPDPLTVIEEQSNA